MRATARCPKCDSSIVTDCEGCIVAGTSYHNCKGKKQIVKVKWKILPEVEEEDDSES